MNNPKDDSARMIYGMTKQTAIRYMDTRKELDTIIARVHKAGYWLSEVDNIDLTGMHKTLSLMGLSIMNAMTKIHYCLENDFAPLDGAYIAVKRNRGSFAPRRTEERLDY
jgi:hypothetical protein